MAYFKEAVLILIVLQSLTLEIASKRHDGGGRGRGPGSGRGPGPRDGSRPDGAHGPGPRGSHKDRDHRPGPPPHIVDHTDHILGLTTGPTTRLRPIPHADHLANTDDRGRTNGANLNSDDVSFLKVIAITALCLLLVVSFITVCWCVFKKVYHGHMSKTAPNATKATSHVTKAAPHVTKRTPHVTKIMTHLTKTKPHVTNITGVGTPDRMIEVNLIGDSGKLPIFLEKNEWNIPRPESGRSRMVKSPPPAYTALPEVDLPPFPPTRGTSVINISRCDEGFPDLFPVQGSPPPAYHEVFRR